MSDEQYRKGFSDGAKLVETIIAERDAARGQLAELRALLAAQPAVEAHGREAALEEVAAWYKDKGWLLDEDDVPAAIRALAAQPEAGAQPHIEMDRLGDVVAQLGDVALPPLPKESGTLGGQRYWDIHLVQEHARAAVALNTPPGGAQPASGSKPALAGTIERLSRAQIAAPVTALRHDKLFDVYADALKPLGFTKIEAHSAGLMAVANHAIAVATATHQVGGDLPQDARAAFEELCRQNAGAGAALDRSDSGAYKDTRIQEQWIGWSAALARRHASAPSQPAPVMGRPSDSWNDAWKREGFNGCLIVASEALSYLAEKPRPSYGEARFNSEHCHQLAHELKLTMRELLAPPAPDASAPPAPD